MSARQPPRRVLIYRDHLLRFSEVWVRSQGEALRGFRPVYAGSKLIDDVQLPGERSFIVNRRRGTGALAEMTFKATGWSPALYRWASRKQPALVHAHFGLDGVLMLPMARRLDVPLVTTFHGYDAMIDDAHASRSFYLHRKYIRRRGHLAQHGALFIAVSKFIRGLLLEQGFPQDRTVVHYIGVDVDFFTPDPAVQRENLVVFVGRLSPEKGCDYLIRAIAEAQLALPDLDLVVIGDGPERASLERMARQTLRRSRFLGVLPQPEIREWLNRARVFCGPSLRIESGRGEAFGLVFAEAQAMGTPVVSFASGGVSEAVAHGETGFLAAERDWRGLAGAIVQLSRDEDLWRRMSAAGRVRTSLIYDLKKQCAILEGLYGGVLAEHTGFTPDFAAARPRSGRYSAPRI